MFLEDMSNKEPEPNLSFLNFLRYLRIKTKTWLTDNHDDIIGCLFFLLLVAFPCVLTILFWNILLLLIYIPEIIILYYLSWRDERIREWKFRKNESASHFNLEDVYQSIFTKTISCCEV